jgi:hypothetical protein
MITQNELKNALSYNENTGIFLWKQDNKFNRVKGGTKAGLIHAHGYVKICINRKSYMAHRLAWLYVHGYFPETIDHINGIRCDNRIENLRPCTRSENNYNSRMRSDNTSGVKGVFWSTKYKKWVARIYVNKEGISLGYHTDFFEACCAIFSARKKYHKEFAYL